MKVQFTLAMGRRNTILAKSGMVIVPKPECLLRTGSLRVSQPRNAWHLLISNLTLTVVHSSKVGALSEKRKRWGRRSMGHREVTHPPGVSLTFVKDVQQDPLFLLVSPSSTEFG